ncbi:MurR/RpiR family transcriptional regulator [Roseovarius pacificus]|uniref:MurR/RpiR family transcriptional regulator n=1 Tax=Roseovarius pacificus TaxID=337701 RepID=UPI002A18A59A|nr:MurR/RpiR family transcriptional regulator [Roseovarius pacificus]
MRLEELVSALKERHQGLSPQLKKVSRYVLDNPGDVGVSSLRDLAEKAQVKPNSLVRLAKALGYDTYDEFRRPFRDVARQEVESYPERVRWLQRLGRGSGGDDLFSQVTGALFSNIDFIFQTLDPDRLRHAAECAVGAKRLFVVGLGSCHPPLLGFHYVAQMALPNVVMSTSRAGFLLDDLIDVGSDDVVVAATYRPYRRETVEAVTYARSRGATIISITDGYSSPIAVKDGQTFVAPAGTPQFFPSTLALAAVLEALLAYIVAEAGSGSIERIETFHRLRMERGLYWEDFIK